MAPAETTQKRIRLAKLAGSIYFILLGLINIIASAYNGNAGWKDVLVLVLFCTPLLVNKKIYYLLFGGAAMLLWGFALYTVFQTHTLYIREATEYNNPYLSPSAAFTIGYLFTAISACFSMMLMYVGTRPSEQREDNL